MKNRIFIIVTFFLGFVNQTVWAVDSNSLGGGVWNTNSTWAGGVKPTSTASVIIKSGDIVTYNVAHHGKITIESGATLKIVGNFALDWGMELDIKAGGKLDVSGNFTTNYLTVTNVGSITVGGNYIQNNGIMNNIGLIDVQGDMLHTNGIITNTGIIDIAGAGLVSNGAVFNNSNGDLQIADLLTINNWIVILNTNGSVSYGSIVSSNPNPIFGGTFGVTSPVYYAIASGDWNSTSTWSKSKNGAVCGTIPGASDTVVIDGFVVAITQTTTVQAISITNTAGTNSGLTLSANSTIKNIWINSDNKNASIILKAIGTASINILGSMQINRLNSNAKAAQTGIVVQNNARIAVSGNLIFNWLNGANENANEIELKDNAMLTVGGSLSVTKANGTSSTADAFNVSLQNYSTLMVSNNLYINHSGQSSTIITTAQYSQFIVLKDVISNLNGGKNIILDAYDASTISVNGDITLNHYAQTGGAGILVRLNNTSVLAAGKNLNLTTNATNGYQVLVSILDDSQLSVVGNISFTATQNSTVGISASSNGLLSISGAFIRNSGKGFISMNGNSTIFYNGIVRQTLMGNNGTDNFIYNNLKIDNAAGFDVTGNITILKNMEFVTGKVYTNNSNMVIFTDNATSNGGNIHSFIEGPVKKIGNDAFTFPIGKNDIWARIAISAPSQTTTEYTAEYFRNSYNSITTNSTLHNVSKVEYWDLHQAVNDDDIAVTLFWEDAISSIISNPLPGSDLVVAHYNGTVWESFNQASISNNGIKGTITSDIITDYSPITFGSTTGVNALPIVLSSFTAVNDGNSVELNWITQTEKNNDFFTLYRSTDGILFEKIGIIAGNGNSLDVHNYTFIDNAPVANTINYYRLSQTDYDGETITFPLKSIFVDSLTNEEIMVYPTTVNQGQSITIKSTTVLKSITVVSNNGFVNNIDLSTNTNEIEFSTIGLNKGLYVITIDANRTQKIIVK